MISAFYISPRLGYEYFSQSAAIDISLRWSLEIFKTSIELFMVTLQLIT